MKKTYQNPFVELLPLIDQDILTGSTELLSDPDDGVVAPKSWFPTL